MLAYSDRAERGLRLRSMVLLYIMLTLHTATYVGIKGAFTLTDKLQQYSMALLPWYSVNTSTQFCTTYFYRSLYRSQSLSV